MPYRKVSNSIAVIEPTILLCYMGVRHIIKYKRGDWVPMIPKGYMLRSIFIFNLYVKVYFQLFCLFFCYRIKKWQLLA